MKMILASTLEGVIGKNNDIPWNVPEDMKFFSKTTAGSVVIMGRNTWESLPAAYRPLPKRYNIVVSSTRSPSVSTNYAFVPSTGGAIMTANQIRMSGTKQYGDVFVIGGGKIYRELLNQVDRIYFTRIDEYIDPTAEGVTTFMSLEALKEAGWKIDEANSDKEFSTSSSGTRYMFLQLIR